ncbi:hypothetical protein [Phaeobacter gallaeciensis]|uniref:hypothetical protein n=1 Tax=Phaeobacter gallaeciensis TaxID=60890 RepID=UPI00237F8CB8|nr:hypothetical protein [Phaeobacter gallaeciensis]MDE4099807.1 hypothetical protein [Phaeobacter gallaeciensis]MDE4108612.1 hypothetical protein [Phaeobacter gallaeciensis]MDE4113058.1 hypothetical protein [Phaeobacter gallaeciensis]MDE4117448.1 hypothetical protein [Phaeobacter gallaeciensis]MDE4122001.1 hypothetical protein [Phaeobacter gallaeciensis]
MAKTLDYQITLYPAHRDGAFVVTQFQMMASYPEKRIQAAGMDDLIDKVTQFAMEHGESCSASVRCLAPRKPPGFKRATENLYFNLVDLTAEKRGDAAALRNGRPPLPSIPKDQKHDTSD